MSQPITSLPYVSNPLEPVKQEAPPVYTPAGFTQQPYAYAVQPAVYTPQIPAFNPYMATPYAVSPQPSQAYYAQPPTQSPIHVQTMLNTVPTIPIQFQKWVFVIKLVSIIQLIVSVWLLFVSSTFFFLLYIPPAICGIIGATKLNKPLLFTYTGLQSFLLVLQVILTIIVIATAASGKFFHGEEVVFYILQMIFWHFILILSITAAWKVTKNIQVTAHAPATELQSFVELNVLPNSYPMQVTQGQNTQVGNTPVPFGVQTAYAPIVMQEMTETQANPTPHENTLGVELKTPKEAEKDALLINV